MVSSEKFLQDPLRVSEILRHATKLVDNEILYGRSFEFSKIIFYFYYPQKLIIHCLTSIIGRLVIKASSVDRLLCSCRRLEFPVKRIWNWLLPNNFRKEGAIISFKILFWIRNTLSEKKSGTKIGFHRIYLNVIKMELFNGVSKGEMEVVKRAKKALLSLFNNWSIWRCQSWTRINFDTEKLCRWNYVERCWQVRKTTVRKITAINVEVKYSFVDH